MPTFLVNIGKKCRTLLLCDIYTRFHLVHTILIKVREISKATAFQLTTKSNVMQYICWYLVYWYPSLYVYARTCSCESKIHSYYS